MRTVLVADGNNRLAELLADLLGDEPDFVVLGVCCDAAATLAAVRERDPDVVLVSERLGANSGIDVCEALRVLRPETTLLLWSHSPQSLPEELDVVDGVLERGLTFRELVLALRRASSGEPLPARPRDASPFVVTRVETGAVVPPAPRSRATIGGSGHLLLECRTCEITLRLDVHDMAAAVDDARAFFVDHGQCQTSIDLTDPRVRSTA